MREHALTKADFASPEMRNALIHTNFRSPGRPSARICAAADGCQLRILTDGDEGKLGHRRLNSIKWDCSLAAGSIWFRATGTVFSMLTISGRETREMDDVNQGDCTIFCGHQAAAMTAGEQRCAAAYMMPFKTPLSSTAVQQAVLLTDVFFTALPTMRLLKAKGLRIAA